MLLGRAIHNDLNTMFARRLKAYIRTVINSTDGGVSAILSPCADVLILLTYDKLSRKHKARFINTYCDNVPLIGAARIFAVVVHSTLASNSEDIFGNHRPLIQYVTLNPPN